ncbi:DNA-binding protein [Nitrincola tapanii]|uniref:DNA-binding protein n=1 Tax=Nitrincola tapanii TaxID=1708751 RepID=A0A5A9W785_9GAMM|nr:DNA-binding protein [Nitrincola tapanii]KAA0875869.1 DNA-binding protein [Nitrincola tapanii]
MENAHLRLRLFEVADDLLLSGQSPTAELLAQRLDESPDLLQPLLQQWWSELSQRVVVTEGRQRLPDMPDSLSQAFVRIWQQALQEANSRVQLTRQRSDIGIEDERRLCDDALLKAQNQYIELEARYREQVHKLDECRELSRALEAEIAVLKSNLTTETNSRKKEEQSRSNLEQELMQLRKAHEDAKRTFDQRIKDEQRHMLESLAKEEVDTRFYRNALEKAREEASKKDSEFTREIHDLQARLARRDVKIETLKTQIKAQDAELLKLRQDAATHEREYSRISSQLLGEANKTKRLEAQLKELQETIRRQNQKQMTTSTEASKRENLLRAQLMEKEDSALRAEAKVSLLEKRLITQDEEIRRLQARVLGKH